MRSTRIVSIAVLALFAGLLTPHTEAQSVSSVVLNEVRVNPPGDNSGQQFIELYGSWQSAAPLWVVILDGDGADTGTVDFAIPLNTIQNRNTQVTVLTGENIPADVDRRAVIVSNSAFDSSASSPLEEGSLSVLLVTGVDVSSISDFDTDNDSFIDPTLPPQLTIVDAIGWTDGDTGDYVYGDVVLNIPYGAPDAATRFIENKTALTTGAWYFGDLSGNSYDPASSSANLPGNTALTPGEDLILPEIVLNEVVLETWVTDRTSRFDSGNYRYVEIRSAQPHTSLQNIYLIAMNSSVPLSTVNLSAFQTDANGLFLLPGSLSAYQGWNLPYTNPVPWFPGSATTYWLSYNPANPPLSQRTYWWHEIDGRYLEILQGGYLLDGLVINAPDDYHVEGASVMLPNNDYAQRYHAASRFPGSMHPNTFIGQNPAPDWYYGRLETFYAYDDAFHSPNLPANAMITPLEPNGRTHNGETVRSRFGFETEELTLTEGDVIPLKLRMRTSDGLLNMYPTNLTTAVVTAESTAIAGSDFSMANYGYPPFPPVAFFNYGDHSDSTLSADLMIRRDDVIEETETFVLEVVMTTGPNTFIEHGRIVIHILDNTPPPIPDPGVTVSATRMQIRAGKEKAYTIVLNTQPYDDVFINIQPGGRCRVNRSQLTFTTENWNVPQRVRVRARNFPNTTCVIHHESEGGGYPPAQSDSTLADTGWYAHMVIADVRVRIVP